MVPGDDVASMGLLAMEVPFSTMAKVGFFPVAVHNDLVHTTLGVGTF